MGLRLTLRAGLSSLVLLLFVSTGLARTYTNCSDFFSYNQFHTAEVVNYNSPQSLEPAQPNLKNRTITLMSYNVANLFASSIDRSDEYSENRRKGDRKGDKKRNRNRGKGDGKEPKPAWKVEAITRIIASQSPDIVVLQEVENLKALALLNQDALQDEYIPYLITGNDERDINIGFLVRKGLNVNIELISHKDTLAEYPVTGEMIKIFSRDLPALLIRENGKTDPLFVVFGHHGKSKRDRNGDRESTVLRTTQVETAAKIIKAFERRYPNTPMIMTGDFNTDTQKDKELNSLREFMKSAFDLSPQPMADSDRVTHAFFPMGGRPQYHQLDDFFVNKVLWQGVMDADILKYTDRNGNPRGYPTSYNERESQPSDHYAIVMKFKIP